MNELSTNPITDPVKAYELALEIRAYELSQTIARNNFFMVFQGVVLAGALGLNIGGSKEEWIWVAVSALGVALSVFQFRMACAGRYQITSTTLQARARELDLIAAAPEGVTTYHFQTKASGTHRASNSKVSYRLVPPIWRSIGFRFDPKSNSGDIDDECHFIGHAILRWRVPSEIAIHVAIALVVFWVVVFFLQFVHLGPVPRVVIG